MEELAPLLTVATAGLAATGMTAAAALRGWQDWLDVRRSAIEARGDDAPQRTIAELKQRVRRLEAIVTGAE